MVRRCAQWLADLFRLIGAAYYWNARKSLYRIGGCRGHCPCQNESDDAIPGRVRCDAMLHWHEPARFHKVCPLLIETPDGWRCSVPSHEVRPYWGRVGMWTAGSLATLYLTGVLSVFLFLRFAGSAPVTLAQVAWPRKWAEIRQAQAEVFLQGAMRAFAQGRHAEAFLSLTSARERDPTNYPAALLLAQISMFQGSVLFADTQFEELLRTHPANKADTLVVYHDTLIQTDRMTRLADYGLLMAQADQSRAVLWVRSTLMAVRAMPMAEVRKFSEAHRPELGKLAPHARKLLEAELAVRFGDQRAALNLLREPVAGPLNPFYVSYQVLRAAELGAGPEAQLLLDFYGPELGNFEHQLGQYQLSSLTNDRDGAVLAFKKLLAQPLNELRTERIAAALILRPRGADYREFSARVQSDAMLEALSNGSALWLTGMVCGEPKAAAYWQTHGRQPLLRDYPNFQQVDFTRRNLSAADSPVHLINALGLPRELVFALYLRTAPQTDVAPAKR